MFYNVRLSTNLLYSIFVVLNVCKTFKNVHKMCICNKYLLKSTILVHQLMMEPISKQTLIFD